MTLVAQKGGAPKRQPDGIMTDAPTIWTRRYLFGDLYEGVFVSSVVQNFELHRAAARKKALTGKRFTLGVQ